MADTLPDTLITPGHQRYALIAGELAISGASELLRFHREGADGFSPFGDPEPVAVLAEALLRTARIEADSYPQTDQLNAEYVSAVGRLAAACDHFLQDQCSLTVLDIDGHIPAEDSANG
ncbi:hypothetical protein [Novosphingobium guangzhouense]|nr:hypothetical protein [Novosphingobium guangzhouense]